MNRREFIKGMGVMGALALPLPMVKQESQVKKFRTVQGVRDWLKTLKSYSELTQEGKQCRHIAHYRWLEATKQGYLMGILWRDKRAASHMDNFTQLEDGSFAMIDIVGNVSPALGWDDWEFDW